MEAIKYYVKGAFQGVKETPPVLEQQEELIADLTAKVADLVADGKSEEEALGVAIASLGDLSALVAEFEPGEAAIAAVPTASVLANRLDLHVIAISVGVGAAVMIGSAALGAFSSLVEPGAGFSLLAVLAVAVWWVRAAYLRYEDNPEAVEVRELLYTQRFRRALAIWAGVSAVVTLFNAVSGTDFWCWPIWVAGGTWALAVKVEQWAAVRAEFRAPLIDSDEHA